MQDKHLVLLFGPPAVGKMTIGQEIAKITGLKLFHNHLSLELANQFFDWSTKPFNRIDRMIRFGIFKEVAGSDLRGLIFTFVWAVNLPKEEAYVDEIIEIFQTQGAQIHLVELSAPLEVRLERNKTENRLVHKPSKRDIPFSEKLILYDEEKHQLNTREGDLPKKQIIKVDTTNRSAQASAQHIVDLIGL